MSREVLTVGEYLAKRLKEIGADKIFGVVGDYVLGLMDVLLKNDIQLIATCNELNAGYAADGHARLNGVGVACVTYNVGGLSLVNAVAGAYAELVPMIVISGAPSITQRRQNLLLHHTVVDYNLQLNIFEKITVAAVGITSPNGAARQIDNAIAACLRERRPVYIEIPSDIVDQPCPVSETVDLPLDPTIDRQALSEAVEEAVELLEQSQRPIILAGVELHRYGISELLSNLLDRTGYPFTTTLLGKSILSEMHPQFIGSYAGTLSPEYVRQRVETADCILCLGAFMSDINLGGYTAYLPEENLINANSDKVKIKHHFYHPVSLPAFIVGLTNKLQARSTELLDIKPAKDSLPSIEVVASQKLSNTRFYSRINRFIDELDSPSIVIAETGDALIATIDLVLYGNTQYIGQALYTSIGYAVPACLGAAIAQPQRRPIVLVGDGAFQMTVQELSTIIRHQLNPIFFLINNDGYTIERAIHEGSYNDIQPWKYHQLPQVFGSQGLSCQAHTEGELEEALEKAKYNDNGLSFIEIHLDRLDCSVGVKRLGKAISERRSPKS